MLRARDLDHDDLVADVIRSPSEKTADPMVVETARREAARRLILAMQPLSSTPTAASREFGAVPNDSGVAVSTVRDATQPSIKMDDGDDASSGLAEAARTSELAEVFSDARFPNVSENFGAGESVSRKTDDRQGMPQPPQMALDCSAAVGGLRDAAAANGPRDNILHGSCGLKSDDTHRASGAAAAPSFEVLWNAWYPAQCRQYGDNTTKVSHGLTAATPLTNLHCSCKLTMCSCHTTKADFDRFGIKTNNNSAFNGDVITLFYENIGWCVLHGFGTIGTHGP